MAKPAQQPVLRSRRPRPARSGDAGEPMQSPCQCDWRASTRSWHSWSRAVGTRCAWNVQERSRKCLPNIHAILLSKKIESTRSKFIKHRADWEWWCNRATLDTSSDELPHPPRASAPQPPRRLCGACARGASRRLWAQRLCASAPQYAGTRVGDAVTATPWPATPEPCLISRWVTWSSTL
jgi:hypothetical protein